MSDTTTPATESPAVTIARLRALLALSGKLAYAAERCIRHVGGDLVVVPANIPDLKRALDTYNSAIDADATR